MERNNYEQITVPELKNLARERGLTHYSRLRKPDLIRRLREQPILEWGNDAAMTNVPFLRPTPYTPPSSNTVKNLIKYLDDVKETPKRTIYKSASELQRLIKLKKIKKEIDNIYKQRKIFEVKESDSALRKFAKVYTIDGKEGFDPQSFIDGARENMTEVIRNNRNTKVKLILKCYMISEKKNLIKDFLFHSDIEVNLEGTDENDIYTIMTDTILEGIANFINRNSEGVSDWAFYKVIKFELYTVNYRPLRGNTWIRLTEKLANKKAIINIKNKDNKCFLWCVLRALNPKDNHKERVDKELMEKENTLNMEGIEYPVNLKDINKFEKQNPSISITVFGHEESVYVLRNSDFMDRGHKIILMLIEENEVKHYCLVKNESRLLSSQVSKGKRKQYFCLRCLNPFWCQEALSKHQEYCGEHESVKIELPKKGTMLKFEKYYKGDKVPFIIYADMEALFKPMQGCTPDSQNSYTNKYQKHEPISFSYYIKCFDHNVYEPVLRSYTGKDAMQKFVEWLEKDVVEIANIPEKKMVFSKEEANQFNKATKCWICKEEFDDTPNEKGYKQNEKVRDHCHFTGRYRGAAHSRCNLNYRKPDFIPVVFHNLSGYDSHSFIRNLGSTEGKIDCIPNNEEKYISFTKDIQVDTYLKKVKKVDGEFSYEEKPIFHKIRFIDNFKFIATRLDSLVNNLPEEAFNNLERYYTDDELSLVKRKGVYPYEYMNSLERFKENKLPPKETFYSRLTGEGISNEDYEHAKNV